MSKFNNFYKSKTSQALQLLDFKLRFTQKQLTGEWRNVCRNRLRTPTPIPWMSCILSAVSAKTTRTWAIFTLTISDKYAAFSVNLNRLFTPILVFFMKGTLLISVKWFSYVTKRSSRIFSSIFVWNVLSLKFPKWEDRLGLHTVGSTNFMKYSQPWTALSYCSLNS